MEEKNIVIIENLETIKDSLSSDEYIQKYILCGEDLDEVIHDNLFKKTKNRIKNTPQIDKMESDELTKIMIYKDYTKLFNGNQFVKHNTINILLYVPTRLHDCDYRIYKLEDKIEEILRKTDLKGIGNLDYIDGRFMDTQLKNYSLYRMVFLIQEGNINAKF